MAGSGSGYGVWVALERSFVAKAVKRAQLGVALLAGRHMIGERHTGDATEVATDRGNSSNPFACGGQLAAAISIRLETVQTSQAGEPRSARGKQISDARSTPDQRASSTPDQPRMDHEATPDRAQLDRVSNLGQPWPTLAR